MRDKTDFLKLKACFSNNNPFSQDQSYLKSLSTGLHTTEGDGVNCDRVEEVDQKIQEKFDSKSFTDVSIRRSDEVKTLDALRPEITLEGHRESVNLMILYMRLISIMQRENNIERFFDFELTPEPATLFKDGLMRKTNKSVLRNILMKDVERESTTNAENCVIDGGALLHKVSLFYIYMRKTEVNRFLIIDIFFIFFYLLSKKNKNNMHFNVAFMVVCINL